MLDWVNDNAWVVWVGVATILVVAELASLELVLLMFGIAAIAAAAATGLGAPTWLALVVFAAVSVLLLAFARPRFISRLHDGPTLTVGHHDLVGGIAIVEEPVSSDAGRITINGQYWTARASDSATTFNVGDRVTVVAIEGATAMVAGEER